MYIYQMTNLLIGNSLNFQLMYISVCDLAQHYGELITHSLPRHQLNQSCLISPKTQMISLMKFLFKIMFFWHLWHYSKRRQNAKAYRFFLQPAECSTRLMWRKQKLSSNLSYVNGSRQTGHTWIFSNQSDFCRTKPMYLTTTLGFDEWYR